MDLVTKNVHQSAIKIAGAVDMVQLRACLRQCQAGCECGRGQAALAGAAADGRFHPQIMKSGGRRPEPDFNHSDSYRILYPEKAFFPGVTPLINYIINGKSTAAARKTEVLSNRTNQQAVLSIRPTSVPYTILLTGNVERRNHKYRYSELTKL